MTHYAPLISALTTLLVTAILLSSRIGKRIQDVPNQRSLHRSPVPRIGGLGLIAGILSGWVLAATSLAWWLLTPLCLLFAVSLLDDVRGLPVRVRLSVHIIAALVLVFGSGIAAHGILVALIAVLAVIWMTNLYNFMDGSDGLAGGMAFFGFATYGVAALMRGGESYAMLNFSIAASALSFLYYNFHPAKVFMGDAGSIPLGFLAAAMGLWGWQKGLWPVWLPPLAFSPFVADATVTLLKRTVRGAKITEAHREHYYQRMVQIGWGHRNVSLFAYLLMFAAGVSAISGLKNESASWFIFLAWGIIYALLMLALDSRWKAFQRGRHG